MADYGEHMRYWHEMQEKLDPYSLISRCHQLVRGDYPSQSFSDGRGGGKGDGGFELFDRKLLDLKKNYLHGFPLISSELARMVRIQNAVLLVVETEGARELAGKNARPECESCHKALEVPRLSGECNSCRSRRSREKGDAA